MNGAANGAALLGALAHPDCVVAVSRLRSRIGRDVGPTSFLLLATGCGMAKVANGSAVAQFYYCCGGSNIGPVGPGEIRRLAASGTIGPDTLVRRDEGKWVAAKNVQGLIFARGDLPPATPRLTKIEPPRTKPEPTTPPVMVPFPEPLPSVAELDAYEVEVLHEPALAPAPGNGYANGSAIRPSPPLEIRHVENGRSAGGDNECALQRPPKSHVDVEKRYAALRLYVTIYRVAGLLCAIAATLCFFGLVVAAMASAIVTAMTLLGAGLLIALGAVSCYALAQGILVFIDMEENTRASRLYLARLYERSP